MLVHTELGSHSLSSADKHSSTSKEEWQNQSNKTNCNFSKLDKRNPESREEITPLLRQVSGDFYLTLTRLSISLKTSATSTNVGTFSVGTHRVGVALIIVGRQTLINV